MSDNRHKRHKQERLVTWLVFILVVSILATGIIFVTLKLKAPIGAKIDEFKEQHSAETEPEEEVQEEPEDDESREALNEDDLASIFDKDEDDSLSENTVSANSRADDPLWEEAEALMEDMTLEQKAAQMFFVTPEALTGVDKATAAGEKTRLAYSELPVGGVIFFQDNVEDGEQFSQMTANLQKYADETLKLPLLLGADSSLQIDDQIPEGINVVFGPMADIGEKDYEDTAAYVAGELDALHETGRLGVVGHFPGYGCVTDDATLTTSKDWSELKESDLIPFDRAIKEGLKMLTVSNIRVPEVTGDEIPASMSGIIITQKLRLDMGYDSVIVTEPMNAQSLQEEYAPVEGALNAIKAGADMVLMPQDLGECYNALLDAVSKGEISKERIDESALRIIRAKLYLKQLTPDPAGEEGEEQGSSD